MSRNANAQVLDLLGYWINGLASSDNPRAQILLDGSQSVPSRNNQSIQAELMKKLLMSEPDRSRKYTYVMKPSKLILRILRDDSQTAASFNF